MKYKLSEKWETVELGAVADYINDKVAIDNCNLHNYISTTNMVENKGGIVPIESLPKAKTVNSFKKGDVLVSNIRPYFKKIWFATFDGTSSTDVLIFKAKENIYNKFLYYILSNNSFFDYSTKSSKGTKMPRGDKKAIMNYSVPRIELKEQQAIADTLSALDNKIELNNKINRNLEQQAQEIFKHWFVDFEFPDENGNPYKSSGGEMVESELGMIPKGWKVVDLQDISKRRNGYSYKSIDMNEESENTLLTLKNFNRNGGYNHEAYRRIDITDRVRAHHYVESRDILLACTDLTQNGDVVGNPIIYFSSGNFKKAIISMDLVKIEPTNEKYRLYIFHTLENRNFKEYARNNSTGTTVLHLNKKSIDEFKMIKASDDIIEEFTRVVSGMESYIIKNELESLKLSTFRDTLLPKLMSGEIRIPLD